MGKCLNDYYVGRLDGRGWVERRDAKYYVLDYKYDKYAWETLKYYADLIKEEFPEESERIYEELAQTYQLNEENIKRYIKEHKEEIDRGLDTWFNEGGNIG